MQRGTIYLGLTILLVAPIAAGAAAPVSRPPNIIIILADDLG